MAGSVQKLEALLQSAIDVNDLKNAKVLTEILADLVKGVTAEEEGGTGRTFTSGGKGDLSLSKQRGVERLPVFTGDKASFPMYAKKVLNFVGDKGLKAMMKEIATSMD